MKRAVAVIATLLVSACTSATSNSISTNIDSQAIPIVAMPAISTQERIVALANGSAEILYALGAGGALVGRDIASTFTGDAGVPVVTAAHSISAEKVLAQKPTLVIIDARSGPVEAIKQIKSAGIRVETVPDAWTLSDVPQKMIALGRLIGAEMRANELISQQGEEIAALTGRVPGVRVAFLYLRGTASVYLLGGKGSGADSLLTGIGAVDVGAAQGLRAFTPMTSEGLIAAKPELFLLMSKGLESVGGIDGLIKLPGIAQTQAGIHRRIITVDDSLLLSFGPRTPQLMQLLANAINREMKK